MYECKVMGKYLRDVRYCVDFPAGHESSVELMQIKNSAQFIGNIFSYYMPKKYELGNNTGRIIITLALNDGDDGLEPSIDETVLSVVDVKLWLNYQYLLSFCNYERKKILLEHFCKGLDKLCKKFNCDNSTFETVKEKLLADGIVFNGFYKKRICSPDKTCYAQMKGYYTEVNENRKLNVVISDKQDNAIKTILVGNYNFMAFDRIKWSNNKTVLVFHINSIQSYKSKKVADDFFSVDIESGRVEYNPVTRESIFEYGLKLLKESNMHDQALLYIQKAKEMGHGKAENILANLKLNPEMRDIPALCKTSKKRTKYN
jgi:hypothetical protein